MEDQNVAYCPLVVLSPDLRNWDMQINEPGHQRKTGLDSVKQRRYGHRSYF